MCCSSRGILLREQAVISLGLVVHITVLSSVDFLTIMLLV